MKEQYEIILPIQVDMGVYKRDTKKYKKGDKKKPFRLNLNTYRNSNSYLLGTTKKFYFKEIKEILKNTFIPQLNKVEIIYELFLKSKRELDISNVLSIVDKYFCDSIVELGVIPDDNYKIIPKVTYKFGGIGDKEFVKVIIKPL